MINENATTKEHTNSVGGESFSIEVLFGSETKAICYIRSGNLK